jgi:hypothetical protein
MVFLAIVIGISSGLDLPGRPAGGHLNTTRSRRQRSAGRRALGCATHHRNAEATTEHFAMTGHRIYKISFASVYPHYVAKAEKKGRTKAEVDEIIRWLTGFSQKELEALIDDKTTLETFYAKARLNPARADIKGVVCGIRVETIAEPLMREIRYLDKLIDELAKGKAMEKILRG